MKLSSSALTFLQLQKGLQLQSNSSLPPQLLQEPQIPGYFWFTIEARSSVSRKKTKSIFSDAEIQFIIEINDTFILYRDELPILQ